MLLTATQIANALGVAIVGGSFSTARHLGTRGAFTVGAGVALCLAVLTGLAAAILRGRPVPPRIDALAEAPA